MSGSRFHRAGRRAAAPRTPQQRGGRRAFAEVRNQQRLPEQAGVHEEEGEQAGEAEGEGDEEPGQVREHEAVRNLQQRLLEHNVHRNARLLRRVASRPCGGRRFVPVLVGGWQQVRAQLGQQVGVRRTVSAAGLEVRKPASEAKKL